MSVHTLLPLELMVNGTKGKTLQLVCPRKSALGDESRGFSGSNCGRRSTPIVVAGAHPMAFMSGKHKSAQRGCNRRIFRTFNGAPPIALKGCPTAMPVHAAMTATAFALSTAFKSAMAAP